MTTTVQVTPKMSATDLMQVLSSLETIAEEANGFGELTSAMVRIEMNSAMVVATYENRDWSVTIEQKPPTVADVVSAMTAPVRQGRTP